jgi:hypothetical protein
MAAAGTVGLPPGAGCADGAAVAGSYGSCPTTWLGDRDRIDVVNDDCVVNVLENNVIRRWRRNVNGRAYPYRHWGIHRDRQQEDAEWRRRWWEKKDWWWWQKKDWRRGRGLKRIDWIVENQNRPLNIDDLAAAGARRKSPRRTRVAARRRRREKQGGDAHRPRVARAGSAAGKTNRR